MQKIAQSDSFPVSLSTGIPGQLNGSIRIFSQFPELIQAAVCLAASSHFCLITNVKLPEVTLLGFSCVCGAMQKQNKPPKPVFSIRKMPVSNYKSSNPCLKAVILTAVRHTPE